MGKPLSTLQRAAYRHVSPDKAYIHVNSHVRSESGRMSDGLEGFARTFLGLAFYLYRFPETGFDAAPEAKAWLESYLEGLTNGSDPAHSGYWGAIRSDQVVVESALIALALLVLDKPVWKRLDPRVQENLIRFFRENLKRDYWQNNWLWFRILQLFALEHFTGESREDEIRVDLDRLGAMYRGDGWYHDGMPREGFRYLDYYNAHAMHFYGLMFAWLQDGRYDDVAIVLRGRARLFLHEYAALFPADGHPPVFGRSMIYRFASVAPFGAALLNDCCDIPSARVKRLMTDTVNAYLARGAIERSGRIGCGVYAEQSSVRETYSGGGSPYWAFKAFSALLVHPNHAFWLEASGLNSVTPDVIGIAGNELTVVRGPGENVLLLNPCMTHPWYGNTYNKFAYSSRFPFSLDEKFPVDNMLLVRRPGSDGWSFRSSVTERTADAGGNGCVWQSRPDETVSVKTTLWPISGGYLAEHVLLVKGEVEFAVGGFPVPAGATQSHVSSDALVLGNGDGASGVMLFEGAAGTGAVHRSRMGLGTRRISIPYLRGFMSDSTSRRILAAVAAGDSPDEVLGAFAVARNLPVASSLPPSDRRCVA